MAQLQVEDIWAQRNMEPEVGQICILLDGREDRLWPLGRIVEVHPHEVDGVTREVEVVTANYPGRPPRTHPMGRKSKLRTFDFKTPSYQILQT